MERYILKYLYDSTTDSWRKRYYDYMKMRLDSTLWAYGAHRGVGNLERTIEHQENYVIPRKHSLKAISGILQRAIHRKFFTQRQHNHQVAIQQQLIDSKQIKYNNKVLCAFHLPWLLPDEAVRNINNIGVKVDFITDSDQSWSNTIQRMLQWYKRTELIPFNELIKDRYVSELKDIYNQLLADFSQTDYDAVLVCSTELFESKILIDVFKELRKISMELLHGIPAIDAKKEIARVDYYLVYGEKLRQNYIDLGCDAKRIAVVGNSKYVSPFNIPKEVRCSLDDVLVLTSSTSSAYQFEWKYDDFSLNDRSILIAYLYNIESVLKQNGVTHARLRPHPHIKKEWLCKYIDTDFYKIDNLELTDSFNKATCCIGQNSTTVIEALLHGVSYIVYEPGDGKYSMTNAKLFPPYDGSDEGLRIANNEEELDEMIKSQYRPSPEFGLLYIEPFKPEVIRDLLENSKNAKKPTCI